MGLWVPSAGAKGPTANKAQRPYALAAGLSYPTAMLKFFGRTLAVPALLLIWPASAKALQDSSAFLPLGAAPTHANMIKAVKFGLLPRGAFVMDNTLSSDEISEIMTNLSQWTEPMAADKIDNLEGGVRDLLIRQREIALIPRKEGWLLCHRFEPGVHVPVFPFGEWYPQAKVVTLTEGDSELLSKMFDQRARSAGSEPVIEDAPTRAPASGGRALVIVDMQKGLFRIDRDDHPESWHRQYAEAVSNIADLIPRFRHVFFLVHTGIYEANFFKESIEIIDELRRAAAERAIIVYKRIDDGAQALWPFLQRIRKATGVGMNIDCCVTDTLLHLEHFGFGVDVVGDATWTTNYVKGTDPVIARDMALRLLERQHIPSVPMKDVP